MPPAKASSSASTDDDGSDYPDDIFGSSSSSRRSNNTNTTKLSASSAFSSGRLTAGQSVVDDDHLATWAKNTRFAVFSHFSQVTSAARNGAHALLSHPLAARIAADSQYGGPRSAGLANTVTSLAQHGPVGPLGPSDPEWRHSEAVKEIGGEFDSARVFLARFARQVAEQAERSRLAEQEEQARRNRNGADGEADFEQSVLGAFEILDLQPSVEKPKATRDATVCVSREEWEALFDASTGAPNVSFSHVRQLVFRRGLGAPPQSKAGQPASQLDLGLRTEVWPFLLGAEEWVVGQSRVQRNACRRARSRQYWVLKRAWAGPTASPLEGCETYEFASDEDPLQASNSEQDTARQVQACKELRETPWMKEQLHRIRVDCVRTDRKMPLFSEPVKPSANECQQTAHFEGIGGRDPAVLQKAAPATTDDDSTARPNAHMQALADILLTYVIWDKSEANGNDDGVKCLLPTLVTPAQAAASIEQGLRRDASKRKAFSKDIPLESYVQGMSDLCAPLYVVCKGDEAQTFWCFVGLMQRMSGMRRQLGLLQKLIQVMDPAVYAHLERTDSLHLFFCFRWLLVLFKREFNFGDILKLWEALWAAELDDTSCKVDHTPSEADTPGLSTDLHLFVVLAILQQHRDPLLSYLYNFDEILLYFQGLSQTIDVESTLRQAEVSAKTLRALIEQKDRASSADGSGNAARIDAPASSALPEIDDDLRSLVR